MEPLPPISADNVATVSLFSVYELLRESDNRRSIQNSIEAGSVSNELELRSGVQVVVVPAHSSNLHSVLFSKLKGAPCVMAIMRFCQLRCLRAYVDRWFCIAGSTQAFFGQLI